MSGLSGLYSKPPCMYVCVRIVWSARKPNRLFLFILSIEYVAFISIAWLMLSSDSTVFFDIARLKRVYLIVISFFSVSAII